MASRPDPGSQKTAELVDIKLKRVIKVHPLPVWRTPGGEVIKEMDGRTCELKQQGQGCNDGKGYSAFSLMSLKRIFRVKPLG